MTSTAFYTQPIAVSIAWAGPSKRYM